MDMKKLWFYFLAIVLSLLVVFKVAALVYLTYKGVEKETSWYVRQAVFGVASLYFALYYFKRARGDSGDEVAIDAEVVQRLIEQHPLPTIAIDVAKGLPDNPWDSKLAGLAYWPKNLSYPHNGQGKPLSLLAQINFSEMPPLEGYPDKGVLQFFIADDDLYGLEFPDKELTQQEIISAHRNYRVIYHEDVEGLDAEHFQIDRQEDVIFPISDECVLTFKETVSYPGPSDYRFDKLVTKGGEIDDDALEDLFEEDVGGCKIGGYAYFTQQDPRWYLEDEEWVLLLQIDSGDGDGCEIMWGDCGVCNFFIRKSELTMLNFDHVLYNWDCH